MATQRSLLNDTARREFEAPPIFDTLPRDQLEIDLQAMFDLEIDEDDLA
jgi:hypothetical protein